MKRRRLSLVEEGGGERPAVTGAGVEIASGLRDFGHGLEAASLHGRVPMHDIFLEGAVEIQELVSDPEFRLIVLLGERAARHEPGMDEDAQLILVRGR